jgi:hypothetical protein
MINPSQCINTLEVVNFSLHTRRKFANKFEIAFMKLLVLCTVNYDNFYNSDGLVSLPV